MIPENITIEHILSALQYIDKHGVPASRRSTRYALIHNGKSYPPKYVISIANRFANGVELSPELFSGGEMTNSVLEGLGFTITSIADANLENSESQDLIQIDFALRDERVNVLAMTRGGLPGKYPHQIMLCKHEPLPENRIGPFILDHKVARSSFKLSEIGDAYTLQTEGVSHKNNYVAYIDSQLQVRVSEQLFTQLQQSGFFSVWDPSAPLKYFSDKTEGYLVLFRVFKVDNQVPDQLLAKRSGRNFYFSLTEPTYAQIEAPVIDDLTFTTTKSELIQLLETGGHLVHIDHNELPPQTVLTRFTSTQLDVLEDSAEKESAGSSLQSLQDKIDKKDPVKKTIIVEMMQYYRDPDVSAYAKKRANGICDCCHTAAPFIKANGLPYLETHHLTPLSEGGEDSISNVCAVCPNCHRALHYSEDKVALKEQIAPAIAAIIEN